MTDPWIPASQAVCHPSEVQPPEIVIPVPLRHSRESGNPGVVEGCYSGVSPLHPAWIPAFAGMTEGGLCLTGAAF